MVAVFGAGSEGLSDTGQDLNSSNYIQTRRWQPFVTECAMVVIDPGNGSHDIE